MQNASHGYPVPHITKDKTKNIMKFDIYYIKSDGSDFWVKYSDSAGPMHDPFWKIIMRNEEKILAIYFQNLKP